MNIESLNHHWRVWSASRPAPTLYRDRGTRNLDDLRFGQYLMNQEHANWPKDAPDVFNTESPQAAYDAMWTYLYDFNKGEDNGC